MSGQHRELEDVNKKGVIIAPSNVIAETDLDLYSLPHDAPAAPASLFGEAKGAAIRKFEQKYLSWLLDCSGWSIARAAEPSKKDRRSSSAC